jgi:DNA mismatch repair protein MutS2
MRPLRTSYRCLNPMNETLEFNLILEAIATQARFSLSKTRILEITPLQKRLEIQRENDRTQAAMTCDRLWGPIPMQGMSDIRLILQEASKDLTLSIPDLLDVARFVRGVVLVKAYFANVSDLGALADLVESLNPRPTLSESIEKCFNAANEVLDTASPKLKDIRRHLRLTQTKLNDTAASFIQRNATYLSEQITLIRNDRVVVLAKNADKNRFNGLIHGESASGQSAYVEPPVLVELNNALASLKMDEEEEIKRICFELSQRIKPLAVELEADLLTCAELDAVFAKARYGNNANAAVASLGEHLELLGARHPLIDPKTVVANSYRLEPHKRVLLITGPNTGGKTVSLKIIGLSCLMAYSGIPVWADQATVPLFTKLYVDIGDDQSIMQSLSTFSAHLTKLNTITQAADAASLVLLDELGGGTDPIEGECLAMAVLDDLRHANAWVVATTHYARLKEYGLQHEDITVASMAFDLESITPTYRFIEGLPGSSYALEIAKRYGLKASVITKALAYREAAKTEQARLTERLQEAIAQNRALQDQLQAQHVELNAKLSKLEAEEANLEKTRKARLAAIDEEAKDYLNTVLEEAETILTDMRQSKDAPIHQNIARKSELNKLISETDDDVRLEKVELGQWVKITMTNQVGQIIALKRNVASVIVNGVKMEVPLTKLSAAKAPEKAKSIIVTTEKLAYVPFELNVIGLTVEEALADVDKHLDDCIRANLPFTRLIHGHGTGALRSAIHNVLKTNKYVESYRVGGQGEGGVGATIVTFKGGSK